MTMRDHLAGVALLAAMVFTLVSSASAAGPLYLYTSSNASGAAH